MAVTDFIGHSLDGSGQSEAGLDTNDQQIEGIGEAISQGLCPSCEQLPQHEIWRQQANASGHHGVR